jgi:hypothetical protein
MATSTPDPQLLPSLGKLARGLSALFWGLPAALIISAETARIEFLQPFEIIPALMANALLLFGLRQMSSFQKQERPWRSALDRVTIPGLVNLGLCPFLFWFNRMPEQPYFRFAVLVLVFSTLLFLFNLNVALKRLGAMLPDETLRHDINQFTALNRWLLALFLVFVAIGVGVALNFPNLEMQLGEKNWSLLIRLNVALSLLLGLSPLAMTMALIWKTKEVIFDSVFGAK